MRRRFTIGSLVATAALILGYGASAYAATPPTASFAVTSDWGGGFEGKVTVKAGSAALSSWKVEFDVPSGTTINSAWDADMAKNGTHYTFTNKSWNGSLAAGAAVSFGLTGAPGGAKVLNCTINGANAASNACSARLPGCGIPGTAGNRIAPARTARSASTRTG
ncbi:chitinase, partial [Nonomuraea sp. NN258]|uniref:cellulose binding domain-containing protein n=1 Tax=Nonomuraea antri TaxID=2730852 RepID=UPI001567CAC0